MNSTAKIAKEVAHIMPKIARRVVLGFLQAVDIPPAQLFTILTLYEKGTCGFSALSKELQIAAPTVTGIVDRLEKGGFARRIPDAEDRRAINVVLTPNGRRVAERLKKTVQNRWYTILVRLPAADQKRYLNILKKIQGFLV